MSRAAQQEALKLLALAKSAIAIGSLDEARNASFAACKLIIANGLMVVMKDDLVTFVMPPQPATAPRPDTRTQREQAPPRPTKRRKRQPIIDTETKDAFVDAAGDFASRLVSSAIRDVVRGR